MATKTAPKMTEAEVLDLLRKRHVRDGNGGAGEYAFMTHVRNGAGFNSNRTFDAVVMNLWPSRGLYLHAFEVKCSRSDWLREMKDPSKAEDAARLVDQFSLVTANINIVQEGELPPTWGHLTVNGGCLVCLKEAPMLHERNGTKYPPVDRQFVVAMLRAGGAVPRAEAPEIEAARQAEERIKLVREERDRLLKLVKDFERAAGVSLDRFYSDGRAAEVGAAVRVVLSGADHVEQQRHLLMRVRDQLRRAADQVDAVMSDDKASPGAQEEA